jgi:hypothetical protein
MRFLEFSSASWLWESTRMGFLSFIMCVQNSSFLLEVIKTSLKQFLPSTAMIFKKCQLVQNCSLLDISITMLLQ